jgi:hypothetical protein
LLCCCWLVICAGKDPLREELAARQAKLDELMAGFEVRHMQQMLGCGWAAAAQRHSLLLKLLTRFGRASQHVPALLLFAQHSWWLCRSAQPSSIYA